MNPPTLRSEINVTPFVDVCLVLLIIFMVITPVLVNGPHVELPEATRAAAVPTAAKVLTLQADHALLLDGRPLAPADLPEALRKLQAADGRLAVRADRRLPYREVRALLAAASAARLSGAELVVDRKPKNEGTGYEFK
jgi:biopolymer transport protein ExbD